MRKRYVKEFYNDLQRSYNSPMLEKVYDAYKRYLITDYDCIREMINIVEIMKRKEVLA